ncbi:Voltage-dependent T-type calcium channel subunit alpha-1H [Bienertia sinuspersici]
MYATSLEKQKKGNLYVYKLATGSRTPKCQPPTTSVTKRIIPSSVWGSLRKSKSKSKPNNGGEKEKEKEEVGKGMNDKERERERKSVSSVEGILMSLAKGNGNGKVDMEERKSVCNADEVTKEKGKEFPFQKGKKEGGRKSVSHVENNVAYVGKFVEKARKSTGAKVENDVVSAIGLLQVKVLVTDMPGFMQIQAFQCARETYDSLEKFSAKHMAYNLKKGIIVKLHKHPRELGLSLDMEEKRGRRE